MHMSPYAFTLHGVNPHGRSLSSVCCCCCFVVAVFSDLPQTFNLSLPALQRPQTKWTLNEYWVSPAPPPDNLGCFFPFSLASSQRTPGGRWSWTWWEAFFPAERTEVKRRDKAQFKEKEEDLEGEREKGILKYPRATENYQPNIWKCSR